MAHHTAKHAYFKLVDRLNRFPQGAPSSDLLFKILELLFSEKEAELVSLLPIKPFTEEKAAAIWQKTLPQTRNVLQQLSEKAILLDVEHRGKPLYVLPPPMAGFFEFSMMRTRRDIDQKLLSELFHEHINVEDDFIRQLFMDGETQLGRAFVHEPALTEENITLRERENRLIPPLNGVHRAVVMAIERDKLQNLIFDNRILKSHRAMAAVLKIILSLPPAKQLLASRQLKSRYLEALLRRIENVYPY